MKRITMLLGAGIWLLCSMFTAFIPSVVEGAVPQLINFQGILRDGSGNPVANGAYSVLFKIYDAPTAGNVLWSETQSVSTTSGLFTTLLGGVTPIPDTLFNDSSRYLGIKVGADPEMTPRQKLSSVGFSYVSGQWTSVDSNLFRLNGNVGVGTAPMGDVTKLDVLNIGSDPFSVKGIRSQVENGSSGDATGGYFVTSTAGTGPHYGVYARGNGNSSSGTTYGTYGVASGGSFFRAAGAYGEGTNNGSGLAYGGYFTTSTSGTGGHIGAYGEANATANYATGLSGYATNTSTAYGVQGYATSSTDYAYGGSFTGSAASGTSYGVYGNAGNYGVYGSGGTNGVYGTSISGDGVSGASTNGYGISGNGYTGGYFTGANDGVFGYGGAYGVYGYSVGTAAVYGNIGGNFGTWGGFFEGDVHVDRNLVVVGSVFKGGGGFKIDDPIDPANKYLYHSFVESPDMKNIYDGVAALDTRGEATVTLPDWFDKVNNNFRYQLTAIGAPGPNLFIAEEISGNHFKIAGGTAGMKVSWQVTGIRQDAYANAHRIPVEEEKTGKERGKYLHPEEYGVSATLGMHYEEEQRLAAEHKKMEEQQVKMEAERKRQEEERAKMEQERVIQEQKVKDNR